MCDYPKREPFFAHKTVRLMHKAAVPAVIGIDAFSLVVIVLHTEDAARYRGPVAFWNSVLIETLGFGKWDRLNKARKRAADAGWLKYSGDGKRQPGMYFVTVPDGYDMVTDEPIEPVLYPENGYNDGYKAGYKAGYDRGMIEGQSGVQPRDDVGEPFSPVPSPNPKPKKTRKKKPVALDDPFFEEFWNAYPRKVARGKAREAWGTAIEKADPQKIISGAKWYATDRMGKDPEFVAHPASWLNAERWADEPVKPAGRYAKHDALRASMTEEEWQAWGLAQAYKPD